MTNGFDCNIQATKLNIKKLHTEEQAVYNGITLAFKLISKYIMLTTTRKHVKQKNEIL